MKNMNYQLTFNLDSMDLKVLYFIKDILFADSLDTAIKYLIGLYYTQNKVIIESKVFTGYLHGKSHSKD